MLLFTVLVTEYSAEEAIMADWQPVRPMRARRRSTVDVSWGAVAPRGTARRLPASTAASLALSFASLDACRSLASASRDVPAPPASALYAPPPVEGAGGREDALSGTQDSTSRGAARSSLRSWTW
ncbi:unnamed protein product [Arctogadus glacialis]